MVRAVVGILVEEPVHEPVWRNPLTLDEVCRHTPNTHVDHPPVLQCVVAVKSVFAHLGEEFRQFDIDVGHGSAAVHPPMHLVDDDGGTSFAVLRVVKHVLP